MKAKILIIEDDENISKNLVILFSSLEYQVISAFSAESALELLREGLPDLIICDINLPGMSGSELKEKLNSNEATFKIPLIFLTARDTYNDLREGMNLAADDYIYKPYKAGELIKSVELRLLKNKGLTKDNSDSIFIKINSSIIKVIVNDINKIIAENQYSRVFLLNGKNYVLRRSLNEWEKILNKNFLRVNRSAIVNINMIEKLELKVSNKFLLLKGSEGKIKVTRTNLIRELGLKTIS
jgi:DNA-binding LytR/AlgR family response regulator